MTTQVKPKKFSLKHQSQNQGHGMSIPARSNTVKSSGASKPLNGPGIFKSSGKVLKNSGVAGAHRIGCK